MACAMTYQRAFTRSSVSMKAARDARHAIEPLRNIRNPRDLVDWLPDGAQFDVRYLMFRFALVPILLRILKSFGVVGLHPELWCLVSKHTSQTMALGPSPIRIVTLLMERYNSSSAPSV